MKNTYIELPFEVKQRIENEVRDFALREEVNAKGNGIELSGRFWLDRRPRPLHRLASTRRSDTPEERERLWSWAVKKSGLVI